MYIGEDGMLDFVIRTKNEEEHISKSIDSVRYFFDNNSKIIIVDNESQDDTLKIIKSKKDKNIEILHIENYFPGKALNLGLKKVKTKMAGILSAHCEIVNFNFNSLDCFNDEKCFGLIGEQIPINNGIIDYSLAVWDNFRRGDVFQNIVDLNSSSYFFHNAFSFISMKSWALQNFDEDQKSKEDLLWAKNQIDRNKYFTFDNRIKANHFFTSNGATWKKRDIEIESNIF